jgi:methyl-accepting chemotaxis protein
VCGASAEQAQGIQGLNTAVTEMDRVTQQNAANAEESASASEELNAQAHEMKGMVEKLVEIVGGAQHVTPKAVKKEFSTKITSTNSKQQPVHPVQIRKLGSSGTKEISPNELIPFDDDELSKF